MDLDRIDREVGGPMRVIERGQIVVLPAADELSWKVVMAAAVNAHFFGTHIWPEGVEISAWKLDLAQRGWVHHNGLPDGQQCRRLADMMQRYYEGIEYDLKSRLGVSAGELWRQRRWRELLNWIDLLPGDTHTARLLANDEAHLEAVMAAGPGDRPASSGPSMADWSLTNSLLTQLIEAVDRNSAYQSQGKFKPHPMPRPATAADRVRNRLARRKHDEMVGTLLPHKK